MNEELNEIKERMGSLDLPLKECASNLVFGYGNEFADIVIIGEAPGKNEDLQGKPFVGRAGSVLDRTLEMIGLKREDVYITNIVKYRPPKNRNPRMDEIKMHSPFLVEQLKAIKPKVIVTLGNFSTKFILGEFDLSKMKKIAGVSSIHGNEEIVKLNNIEFKVVPVYHPAATLYNPNLRPDLENDFKKIRDIIDNIT